MRDPRGRTVVSDGLESATAGEGIGVEQLGDQQHVRVDPSALSLLASPDLTSDLIPIEDTVAGTFSAVALEDLPSGDSSAYACQVDTFTADGTWNKPAGCVAVYVAAIGGGGGGGGGRKGAAATNRYGGGGGGGGAHSIAYFTPGDLPSTVAVTVGVGGTAGTAATADSNNGGAGTAGSTSSFGSYLRASGGGGGAGGNNLATTTAGGGGSSGLYAGAAGGTGTNGVGTASAAVASTMVAAVAAVAAAYRTERRRCERRRGLSLSCQSEYGRCSGYGRCNTDSRRCGHRPRQYGRTGLRRRRWWAHQHGGTERTAGRRRRLPRRRRWRRRRGNERWWAQFRRR